MKPLRNLLILILALQLLPGAAQTAQGLGRTVRAVASTPQGLAAITEDAKVLLSTDQWMTTTEIFDLRDATGIADDDLHAIAARGSRVVVGGTDSLIYTADLSVDAEEWEAATVPSSFDAIRGIASRSDEDTWMALTETTILRSSNTNAGTWQNVYELEDISAEFTSITWVSGGTWIAVGSDGIWRSTNDGAHDTWSKISGVSGHFTAVAADGQGNVLAVGDGGIIYLSVDSGETFEDFFEDEEPQGEYLTSVVATGENTWAIGGLQRTLLLLDDGGNLSGASVIGFEEASEDEILGLVYENGTLMMAGVEEIPAPSIEAVDDPNTPVEVTLTQSADDTLWYTTDGSDPRTSPTRQEYEDPFTVTGTVTVKAVGERDGVFSPVVSQEIIAGEDLEPFSIESISVSGTTVTLIQDVSTTGYTYGLEYTEDLSATPQVWQSESPADQPGTTGESLTWEITPVPASPRFWRIVVVPNTP